MIFNDDVIHEENGKYYVFGREVKKEIYEDFKKICTLPTDEQSKSFDEVFDLIHSAANAMKYIKNESNETMPAPPAPLDKIFDEIQKLDEKLQIKGPFKNLRRIVRFFMFLNKSEVFDLEQIISQAKKEIDMPQEENTYKITETELISENDGLQFMAVTNNLIPENISKVEYSRQEIKIYTKNPKMTLKHKIETNERYSLDNYSIDNGILNVYLKHKK